MIENKTTIYLCNSSGYKFVGVHNGYVNKGEDICIGDISPEGKITTDGGFFILVT